MYGPPDDAPGECNSRLFLGDDYGDGTCTIRCKLPHGHGGPHEERFREEEGRKDASKVCVQWQGNDREDPLPLPERVWGEYVSRRWTNAGEPADWAGWDDEMPPDFEWEKYRHFLTEGV